MVKKGHLKFVAKYFPYPALWMYVGLASFQLVLALYLLLTAQAQAVGYILIGLAVAVLSLSFLLDITFVVIDRKRALFIVQWRKWYSHAKREKRYHLASLRAIVFRHSRSFYQDNPWTNWATGRHAWQMYAVFEDGEESQLFPDHAPIKTGPDLAQEIAEFAGCKFVKEDVDLWKSPY